MWLIIISFICNFLISDAYKFERQIRRSNCFRMSSIESQQIMKESQRLKRARLRLAEAQGIIPIGASENKNISLEEFKSLPSSQQSKVREISWRVAEPAVP